MSQFTKFSSLKTDEQSKSVTKSGTKILTSATMMLLQI